ncbi:hypothetical protein T440DRAFT_99411 [Plenodomus tracheiphilus IPT5]|uniref:Uncharacterized protein n=1 Tax=Plenodomus tracheiphilus IPT5 TaxID=1408161 RepID=A0A6A7BL07_9PLEO|nr:hypothetical protein T440DRAFT_99411 [Plenodomus tracheiphilus IPT5]
MLLVVPRLQDHLGNVEESFLKSRCIHLLRFSLWITDVRPLVDKRLVASMKLVGIKLPFTRCRYLSAPTRSSHLLLLHRLTLHESRRYGPACNVPNLDTGGAATPIHKDATHAYTSKEIFPDRRPPPHHYKHLWQNGEACGFSWGISGVP